MPLEDKKEQKNEISIRNASEFKIEYPDNHNLEEIEKNKIQDAIDKGGIAVGQKTFISEKSIPILLNTDIKGAQIVLNNVPIEEIKQYGEEDYLSSSQLKKEITDRSEQPRSTLEREILKYSEECIEAFSKNSTLEKERSIQADRIKKDRLSIGKKTIKKRNAHVSEMSGKPLNGEAEVHHKNRVADKPEEFSNPENLVILTRDEHKKFHQSGFLPTEEGFEKFKEQQQENNEEK